MNSKLRWLFCLIFIFLYFEYILLNMLLQLSHFFLPFISLHPAPPLLPAFSPLSSCPWVIHIRSLAYPFPILFLTSPCPFCTYHLCYLFPVPLPPFYPFAFPADNLPCNLHFCDSVPVFVFVFLGSVVDGCGFVIINCSVLIFFFLR